MYISRLYWVYGKSMLKWGLVELVLMPKSPREKMFLGLQFIHSMTSVSVDVKIKIHFTSIGSLQIQCVFALCNLLISIYFYQ